jgi:DTW domain-containing protein YfiP
MPIGTARMAHLALPRSVLRVGLELDEDPVVRAIVDGPEPTYVLFPGPGARDLGELPRDRAITLVVLDGTWSQAAKLLRKNPRLAALPQVRFSPRRESRYRIRRQPAEHCLSTIEACAEALALLEPDAGRIEELLAPFDAMVETQLRFATVVRTARQGASRRRARRAARPRGPGPVAPLVERPEAIVLVQGEANAWPARAPDRPPPELVHWLAVRPATGARFEAVIAPRRPLSPGTPAHVALSPEALAAGTSIEEARARFAAFVRDDDVVCAWGSYYLDLARAEGLRLPAARLDLRAIAASVFGRRYGSPETCAEALALGAGALGAGRGGRRLGAAAAVARLLVETRAPDADDEPGSDRASDIEPHGDTRDALVADVGAAVSPRRA